LRSFILLILIVQASLAAEPDPVAVNRSKDRAPGLAPSLMHDTDGETIGPVIRNGKPALPITGSWSCPVTYEPDGAPLT
jgi:hypothetical protein